MKKLYVLLLAVILFSCGKEKDPAPASLVGKWNISGLKTTTSLGGQSLIDLLVSTGMTEEEATKTVTQLEGGIDLAGQFKGTIEFKADKTWIGTGEGDDGPTQSTGKWDLSADGKTLTLTNDDQSDGDEGAEPGIFTVSVLTATDLQLDYKVKADDEELPVDVLVALSLKRI